MQRLKDKNKIQVPKLKIHNVIFYEGSKMTDYESKNGISIDNLNSASKSGYVISKLRKISATVKWPELEADI